MLDKERDAMNPTSPLPPALTPTEAHELDLQLNRLLDATPADPGDPVDAGLRARLAAMRTALGS